jgi:hypothetical protein
MGNEREMTYGEKAVGLTFNPDGNPQVHAIKELYAEMIDALNDVRRTTVNQEQVRLLSIAITEAQSAQMWAVKAVTWPY